MATRSEVKAILKKHGYQKKFHLRTVGFSDLARCDVQVLQFPDYEQGDIKDWNALKDDFKPLRVIVD